jgi:hypothetical protein
MCGGRLCSRGMESSSGGDPSSSSSSSIPPPLKSAGPLCSCAPPYYKVSALGRNLIHWHVRIETSL